METVSTDAPGVAQPQNLDLLRHKIVVQLECLHLNIGVAVTYLELALFDRIEMSMNDVRSRVTEALALTRQLLQAHQDRETAIEAAVEFRAERDGRIARRAS